VQLLAMAQFASRPALIVIWGLLAILGGSFVFLRVGDHRFAVPRRLWPVLGVIVAATAVNLVAALAPSTKIDELHYHMLLPSRIVSDGGLRIYQSPFEAAILPQMHYQIFFSPLHALGLPDAANVVSWTFSIMLVWVGWSLLREHQVGTTLGYWCLAAIVVGMYPVVYHVTGGAHAFGDLALATAIVILGMAKQFFDSGTPVHFAATVSVLSCAAASSKFSLWPLAASLLIIGVAIAWRVAKERSAKAQLIAAAALPWLALVLPLAAWTFMQTGSPFGPLLAGRFGRTVYDIASVNEVSHRWQGGNLRGVGFESLVNYSPLIWIAAVGLMTSRSTPRDVRLWAAIPFFGQLTIIYVFLPYHPRFLGGVEYGLLILFAIFAADSLAVRRRRLFDGLVLALVLPWLAIQVWYGKQFVPVVLGLQEPETFYGRYVPLYRNYQQLDGILPRDAILLVRDFRAASVYSPRPIIYTPHDIPDHGEVFFVSALPVQPSDLPPGYTATKEVYFDPAATSDIPRTPGRLPKIGPLHVTLLQRDVSIRREAR
jgi:hypothetical protein